MSELAWRGEVLIVGGGQAGTEAALTLHKAGRSVLVIEADTQRELMLEVLGRDDIPIHRGITLADLQEHADMVQVQTSGGRYEAKYVILATRKRDHQCWRSSRVYLAGGSVRSMSCEQAAESGGKAARAIIGELRG